MLGQSDVLVPCVPRGEPLLLPETSRGCPYQMRRWVLCYWNKGRGSAGQEGVRHRLEVMWSQRGRRQSSCLLTCLWGSAILSVPCLHEICFCPCICPPFTWMYASEFQCLASKVPCPSPVDAFPLLEAGGLEGQSPWLVHPALIEHLLCATEGRDLSSLLTWSSGFPRGLPLPCTKRGQ